jgi:hypothetical protein
MSLRFLQASAGDLGLVIWIRVSSKQRLLDLLFHSMNGDFTSQQNERPERNVTIVCTFVVVLQSLEASPLQRPLFPPRQQPQKEVPQPNSCFLFYHLLPPRNETSVDGMKIGSGPIQVF